MSTTKQLLEAARAVAHHPDYEKIPGSMIRAMADLRRAVAAADDENTTVYCRECGEAGHDTCQDDHPPQNAEGIIYEDRDYPEEI